MWHVDHVASYYGADARGFGVEHLYLTYFMPFPYYKKKTGYLDIDTAYGHVRPSIKKRVVANV